MGTARLLTWTSYVIAFAVRGGRTVHARGVGGLDVSNLIVKDTEASQFIFPYSRRSDIFTILSYALQIMA